MKVNKFNIHWQIVRVKARSISDIDDKLNFVLTFLDQNKNVFNFHRVRNWLKTSAMSYKDIARRKFIEKIDLIDKHKQDYESLIDNDNDLQQISSNNLQRVLKDLANRKYNFQFKSIPKDHIDFVEKIKAEINKR